MLRYARVAPYPEKTSRKLTANPENEKESLHDETSLYNSEMLVPFTSPQGFHQPVFSYSIDPSNHNKDSSSSSNEEQVKFHNSSGIKVLSIHPRYSIKALEDQFHNIELAVKRTPTELYEIKLYNLCKKFNLLLSCKDFSFTCVDNIHHIYQLKAKLSYLTENELASLDLNLEHVLAEYPAAWIEYNIFTESLELISALLIKWKMISKYNYSYRTSGRSINVRVLDIYEMNKNIITMETLWLSLMVLAPPLKDIVDQSVKQYAVLLQNQMLKTIRFLLRMNQNCDFGAYPNIDGMVAAKRVKIVNEYGIWPDFDSTPISYQKLRQPTGLIARCFKEATQYNAILLKEHLAELELVYRTFERTLIGNFLYVFGMNGNRRLIPKLPSAYCDD